MTGQKSVINAAIDKERECLFYGNPMVSILSSYTSNYQLFCLCLIYIIIVLKFNLWKYETDVTVMTIYGLRTVRISSIFKTNRAQMLYTITFFSADLSVLVVFFQRSASNIVFKLGFRTYYITVTEGGAFFLVGRKSSARYLVFFYHFRMTHFKSAYS